ncbi:hypothetical protein [Telmatospirillum siberiense]|uniref:Uncharacterized protein n=1 Tax=Telmatospirillum siberiense TaxID=382514 RepID=A0A2N3PQC9_9PROT|nr:hypothetical protein [Telmatospirillum siberiense]PKU22597.1 hypothetical protein CWS72_20615 [Telmatospirillum siberiense]
MSATLKMIFVTAILSLPALSVAAAAAEGGVADGPCVEVEIGGDKAPSLTCLNQRLRQQVEQIHPTQNIPPLDASSSSVKLGGYNQAALAQQYGANFGKSIYPFRPTSTYGSALSVKP